MRRIQLVEGLRALPREDRRLLIAFIALALTSLALGMVYGALVASARAGFIELGPVFAYQMLNLHGVTIFFYWLYFAQAALVLILATIYTDGIDRVFMRPLAWAGFAVMAAGFVISELVPFFGAVLLYDGNPELIQFSQQPAGFFYLGYTLLAVGLFAVATTAVATAFKPRFSGAIASWSPISFAAVAWAGLLMVSAVAAINAFLPAMLWTFGLAGAPKAYTMSWNILFHNVHYLPLMATVVLWYVLVEAIVGVKSVFGPRFSKIVFASYLVFVPPTSVYHMFLDPNLAEAVKAVGSLLSLFISVPTVLVFLIIVTSVEAHARAHGAKGLFGWIRGLPWKNPAMAGIGMAVVNLAIGGVFAFVLIQERIAPLLSDTFMVPAYFHFLTLGTVTMTFMAMLLYVIPALTDHALWRPGVLSRMPYVMTAGLVIFGGAGITAGFMGVPRRTFDVAYDGVAPEIWSTLMAIVGIGAVFMVIALATTVYGLFRTLARRPRGALSAAGDLLAVSWGGGPIGRSSAWVAPAAVLALIVAMYGFTVVAFELMQSLPILSSGGGH